LHGIMVRTFGQDRAAEMAQFARVPVINGLTDLLHPCQVLADLQTVAQRFRDRGDVGQTLRSVKYAWIGDGNNMAHAWIDAAAILGLELTLACPEGYDPDPAVLLRGKTGRPEAKIRVVRDPAAAVAGADVISTDVWASMGQEEEAAARRRAFAGFCVDDQLLAAATDKAIVLHCLPAHRGEEISEAVLEGPRSAVWRQAENRLHTQKAVLELFLA
jgi:ornithine carbamoyltransferase